MKIEPILRVSLALHSAPGVYALLLGSGVSRAAGIPTGWEVVLDLVTRVMAMKGIEDRDDPAGWYYRETGRPPEYSVLLEQLAATPLERRELLNRWDGP